VAQHSEGHFLMLGCRKCTICFCEFPGYCWLCKDLTGNWKSI